MKFEMKDVFFLACYASLLWIAYDNSKSLEAKVDSVRQENTFNDGIGFYMPGSSCVIKATADIEIQRFKDMMAVCAARHLQYLESQKEIEKK